MSDERLQILRMLEEGKITSDEAVKLLDTVEDDRPQQRPRKNRFVKVRISGSDGEKVNVNLPIGLAKVALRIADNFGGKLDERFDNLDLESIIDEIEEGVEGKLVEVESGDERVEIFVE